MEFKQLQSFVAVIKQGSFTRAAETLYLSQPTISAHIRALEEELGSCLIIRTTKSIEVTPRGWAVYESAVSILEQRDRLLHRWEEGQKLIRLGASTIPAGYILPELLPACRKQEPEVRFLLHQGDSQDIIDALLSGSLDVGLIGMESQNDTLICLPFYSDRMVLITPVNEHFSALKERQAVPLEALLQEPVILREEGSGSLQSASRLLAGLGIPEEALHITARMRDQEAIKHLVASGLGISILSEKAARRDAAENRLLVFDLPRPEAARFLYIAYHGKFVLPGHIMDFIDYVKSYYGEPQSL